MEPPEEWNLLKYEGVLCCKWVHMAKTFPQATRNYLLHWNYDAIPESLAQQEFARRLAASGNRRGAVAGDIQ